MPIKECTGNETQNGVDTVLNEVEDLISTAKGKGVISEDKYDEIMNQAEDIREKNNRLKCMLSSIPPEGSTPESILQEVEEELKTPETTVEA